MKEAKTLGESYDSFEKYNAKLFGISVDSVASHERFANKYNLPMTLLADAEKEIVRAYEVKNLIGIAKRSSFLIDPNGKVAKIYPKVKPDAHAAEVLKDLEELSNRS